ncbi:MAG: PKD domain-containing protein [Bacteroidota bacterium]
MMRLQMSGLINSLDETVIYYQEGATDDFDNQFDSYKLYGPNPAPHISQEYNSVLMAINGIEPVAQTFSINIRAVTHISGNFTITATDFSEMPKGTCINLTDIITGTTVDILNTPYAFNLSDTTTMSRFILSITHYQLPIISQLTQPSCQLINGGKLKATGMGYNSFNYIWKDSSGTIIKTTLNISGSDSLENLSSGNYALEISPDNNNCYFTDTIFSIIPAILPNVAFVAPDTLVASISQNYTILNQSSNCSNYQWDFGDGIGNSSAFEPSYSYTASGIYKTKLIGISSTGCVDSIQKYISVIDLATYSILRSMQNMALTNMGNNKFKISAGIHNIDKLFVNLTNLKGETVLDRTYTLNKHEDLIIDLNNTDHGICVLSIGEKDQVLKYLKIFIN